MHNYTDEQLVSYADGELEEAQAQAIAQAAAGDPELARRIDRFVQTRALLRDAFAGKLAEPVPKRLLEALQGPSGAKVVPLRRPWFANRVPMALAASIALTVGLAALLLSRESGPPAIAGLPPDAVALSRVLERNASGEPGTLTLADGSYEILPTSTLRTDAGWCREFESSLGQGGTSLRARAMACRQADGAWQVVAAAASAGATGTGGEYAPAGSAGPDLAAGLGPHRVLTPAQETELIRDNWQTTAP